jgi:demethylmenaquinone methyltransferase/2-methoxy-6-polyprenyl-1,4-benzoquinol methylase
VSWLFDWGAIPYDLMTQAPPWRAHCREMARVWGEGRAACRVLDLGTGPAVSAIEAARERGADTVVGLDISAQMLRRARSRVRDAAADGAGARVSLLRADARTLPFPDASFDAVTGHSFLYLVPFRERALAESLRVLRPGGRCVFLEPRDGPGGSIWKAGAGDLRMTTAMTLWRLVSASKGRFEEAPLRALLESSGFRDVRLTPTLAGLGWLAVASRP